MLKSLIAFLRRLVGRRAVASDRLPAVGLVQILDIAGSFPTRPLADTPEAAQVADNMMGTVHHFAGRFETSGWNCDGRSVAMVPRTPSQNLYSLIGNSYGGAGAQNFLIPDLRDTIPVCTDFRGPLGARNAAKKTLTMMWVICVDGNIAPTCPTVGMLALISGNFVPDGWRACNGQSLPIRTYSLLFDAIGTAFGGDGTTNFALPDLRGRTPVGIGTLPDGTAIAMGQKLGDGSDGQVMGLGLNIVIASMGEAPPHGPGEFGDVSLLGEVQVLAFSQPILEEAWWVPCDGRPLPVDAPLFGVIGNTYGGDGVTTYALPDLRGRAMTGYTLT